MIDWKWSDHRKVICLQVSFDIPTLSDKEARQHIFEGRCSVSLEGRGRKTEFSSLEKGDQRTEHTAVRVSLFTTFA